MYTSIVLLLWAINLTNTQYTVYIASSGFVYDGCILILHVVTYITYTYMYNITVHVQYYMQSTIALSSQTHVHVWLFSACMDDAVTIHTHSYLNSTVHASQFCLYFRYVSQSGQVKQLTNCYQQLCSYNYDVFASSHRVQATHGSREDYMYQTRLHACVCSCIKALQPWEHGYVINVYSTCMYHCACAVSRVYHIRVCNSHMGGQYSIDKR